MNKFCPDCKRIIEIENFHKEKVSKDGFGYACKECIKIRNKKKYENYKRVGLCADGCGNLSFGYSLCKNCRNKYKARTKENRLIVLRKYGGKCVCCGEKQFEFLTFEHKDNNGARHRKELGSKGNGKEFVRWLIKNNYPNFIEILCWNCNCSKGYWGECPHKKKE